MSTLGTISFQIKRLSSFQFSGENATWDISKQQIFSVSEGMVAHYPQRHLSKKVDVIMAQVWLI